MKRERLAAVPVPAGVIAGRRDQRQLRAAAAGGMRAEIRSVRAVSARCSAELMIRPIRFADGGSISSSRQCARSSSRTRSG